MVLIQIISPVYHTVEIDYKYVAQSHLELLTSVCRSGINLQLQIKDILNLIEPNS